ncbi:tetratricopeptide repeat protein [Microbulbifer sp. M83]|uniref:tetratricopeptide repeat protein n=1 Tax=Microbulbifer sp. M83 TaxID=3118246 RepID=UPI002FE0F4F3
MPCTDDSVARVVTRAAVVLTLVWLAACSQTGPRAGSDPGATGSATAPGTAASPNPYLASRVSVPGAARSGMAQARELLESGDAAAAEKRLLGLTAEWPELSGLWLNLGIVQRHLEKYTEAEQSLRSAIAANDDNVFAWNTLGALLRDRGQFDAAEQHYRGALERWPDFAAAHRNLGILYDLYLQRPQEALQHYRRAQELHQLRDPEQEPDRQLAGWIVDLERRL